MKEKRVFTSWTSERLAWVYLGTFVDIHLGLMSRGFRSCSGVCGGKDVEGDHENKAFDLREAGAHRPKGIAPLCET